MSAEGGARGDGRTSEEGIKRIHAKGEHHDFRYDILDDPNIKAESGWEQVAGYWEAKTCKKYVKMYHIDKLWPRENHEKHTIAFGCRPLTCNDQDFANRCTEVWRVLFNNKPMVKGLINYTLAAMVYVERILQKKVDWSTYPGTTKYPIHLPKNQKDIPSAYSVQVQPTSVFINTATPTTKVSEVEANVSELVSRPPSTRVCNVSLGGVEGQNKNESCPSKVGEDEKREVAEANATITNLLDTNALDPLELTPQNPTLLRTSSPTLDRRSEIFIQQRKEKEPEVVAKNSSIDGTTMKTKYPHLSTLGLPELEFLNQMRNAEVLENMFEVGAKWKTFMDEREKSNPQGEPSTSTSPRPQLHNFAETATSLTGTAAVLSDIAPTLLAMAEEVCKMSPALLNGAITFLKFIPYVEQVVDEQHDFLKQFIQYEEEWPKLRKKCDNLEKDLETWQAKFEREHSIVVALQKQKEELEKEIAQLEKATPATNNVIVLTENNSQETCDDLSLPLDKVKALEKSHILEVDDMDDVNNNKAATRTNIHEPRLTLKDACMQTDEDELQGMKQKLEEAIHEKVLAISKLERFEQAMTIQEYLPSSGLQLQWLTWIQKLHDTPSVVLEGVKRLQRHAVQSDEKCKAVMTSLQKFKSMVTQCSEGFTDITCWGDMDAMFDRLNHTKKEEVALINWALEAEEGWVPYDTWSAHLKKTEKHIVHARDPAAVLLEDHCCVCRGPFGPEGALIMGQCRHTFHVTCIIKLSLHRSSCPQCRCPLSSRFYEMFGILEKMPPGHEYNRWTLPLDQGPFKFQNFKHWGTPLDWDPKAETHRLNEESLQEVDPFMWMTRNNHIELRAKEIDNDESRELFCRSMGGHWSVQHQKFFRFPEKEVRTGKDNIMEEVEHTKEFSDQYGAYNHALIGRALFLSKLEEAAKVRSVVDTEGQSEDTGHPLVEVAKAFDKRMDNIINQWREFLLEGNKQGQYKFKTDDEVVHGMIERVDSALRALKMAELDLTPKRKQKRKIEGDNDDFSPELKRSMLQVDMEVQSGGPIVRPSQQRVTRGQSAKLMGKDKPSRNSGEGSSGKKKKDEASSR